ncbi:MFS transporter [Streptomyces sp. NPDC049881]|uniref:MFS transporter n=1 Tax=Streptomyces sp. NPDC049881 TaxID=3155778 RepID=UPI00343DB0CA
MKHSPLRHPAFRLLWTANTASGAGAWLLVVAVPFQAYELTGSATATGLALVVESLPALVAGPWIGSLLDRADLARAMAAADLAAMASVALLFLADGPERLWLLYAAVLGESLAATVLRPAGRALVPPSPAATPTPSPPRTPCSPAPRASSGWRLPRSAHSSSPGQDSPPSPPWPSADTRCRRPRSPPYACPAPPVRRPRPARPADSARGCARWPATRRCADRSPSPPVLHQQRSLTANAALTALLVPFTVTRLGAPGHALGHLLSGLGAGFLLGAALSRPLIARLGTARAIAVARLGLCPAYIALAAAHDLPQGVAATFLIGIPGSVLLIAVDTHVQRTAPPAMLARVLALFLAADALAAIGGGLAGPAASASLGPAGAVSAVVCCVCAVGVVGLRRGRGGTGV